MDLVNREFPNARLLSYGLIMTWGSLMFGKNILSSSVSSVISVSTVFFVSTLSLAISYLIVFAYMRPLSRFSPLYSIWFAAGALTISSAFLVFANHVNSMTYFFSVFCSAVTGISSAILYFWSAVAYSTIPPRKSLLYAVFSLWLSVAVYFIVFGSPLIVGKFVFCLIPLFVALLLPFKKHPPVSAGKKSEGLLRSSEVWRFALSVLLIALVINIGVGYLQVSQEQDLLYTSVSTGQLLSLLLGAILFVYAIRSRKDFDYCQIFYPIIFSSVILLALSYILGSGFPFGIALGTAIRNACSITMWCMLVYFIYAKSTLQAFSVFCVSQMGVTFGGLFGNMLGNWFGISGLANKTESSLAYVVLIVVMVAVLTFLFPERTLKKLIPVNPQHLQEFSGTDIDRERVWANKCLAFVEDSSLTQREREVFVLIANNESNESIAEKLTVSSLTVKTHRQNIYSKLNVHSAKELIKDIKSS